MKVSEITAQIVADCLREDGYSALKPLGIPEILTAAKSFVSSYTGIPETTTDESVKTLDDYSDFYIAVLVLCQDMYDNRSYYVDKNNVNRVVETILGMHSTNLL